MNPQRYHIGKNGPGPCNAHPERPNGRACRFGEDRHGTLQEVTARWESEQEAQNAGMLEGTKKVPQISAESAQELQRHPALSDPAGYRTSIAAERRGFSYEDKQIALAIRLAESRFGELDRTGLGSHDDSWSFTGSSLVNRYVLEDGRRGYFKAITPNSNKDHSFYWDYDSSALDAAVSDVNSYRMAQALGGGFEKLVPETTFKNSYSQVGTLQREVEEDESRPASFADSPELREDYRKAAIFDFVIGNADRNYGNYLFGTEPGESSPRLRLIDNAFAFPRSETRSHYNMSAFADSREIKDQSGGSYNLSDDETEITVEDRKALERAREEVSNWMKAGTIDDSRGRATVDRIDELLSEGRLMSLRDWYSRNRSRNY